MEPGLEYDACFPFEYDTTFLNRLHKEPLKEVMAGRQGSEKACGRAMPLSEDSLHLFAAGRIR